MMSVALMLAVVMVRFDVARNYRVLLFLPFLMAAFGAFQGLYRTCPGHAMKQTAEDDGGEAHKVFNRAERSAARKNAFKVTFMSVITASVATLFVFAVP